MESSTISIRGDRLKICDAIISLTKLVKISDNVFSMVSFIH